MILEDYMTHPSKGSAIMHGELRRSLDTQYASLQSKIQVTWYFIKNQFLIAHVKVPSRSVDRLFYDVILEFDINTIPNGKSVVNKSVCKVFSNCPSFTYTYAHVFDKNSDLCKWTKRKYPIEIFTNKPVERNPYKIISYERSIYLATKYIFGNGRNYVEKIKVNSIKGDNYIALLDRIQSSEAIETKYKVYMKQKSDEKKKEKGEKPSASTTPSKNSTKKTTNSSKQKASKGISKVKKIKSVKKSK